MEKIGGAKGVEGLLFYWILWVGWIIITFFYPKNHPDRLNYAAWLLISILLSTTSVPLGLFEITGTGFFMMVTSYIYFSRLKKKKRLYFLLSTFILMLVTVCFLLYELFDPVWLFMKREWLLAIILTCVTLLLLHDQKQRMIAIILGFIHGEIFYSLILAEYSFTYPVATLYSLDSFALTLSLLFGWNLFEQMASYFDKQFHSEEKEKQKLS